MPIVSLSRRRRWMVRVASVLLLVPLAAMSATASSSPAEPAPAIQGNRHAFQRVVVSTSDGQFDADVANQGWWANRLGNNDDNDNYFVGECSDRGCSDTRFRNFFTFKLPSMKRDIAAARLVLRRYDGQGGVTETFELHRVRTPARELNNNEGVDAAIYRDLGTGARYGRFRVGTALSPKSSVGLWLNVEVIADINAARGSYFSIGGTLASAARSNGHAKHLFAGSSGRGVQELRLFVEER